jgi:hypothetical protein
MIQSRRSVADIVDQSGWSRVLAIRSGDAPKMPTAG